MLNIYFMIQLLYGLCIVAILDIRQKNMFRSWETFVLLTGR